MKASKKAKEENKNPEKRSIKIEPNIYRVNYPSHKGYRVYLKFKDTIYQKVFSFADGERKALSRARRWRKEKLREIQNSSEARNPLKRKQSNNKSGIIGVRRGKTAWSEVWSATWTENGVQFHRSFSVEKYGENEAFALACTARAEAEKRIYGQIFQEALKNVL
ncbi:MAG: AP2 domain-containing protein [Acidobacteriota bacterium]|nr:AP2 domain-containing protein [Acidobacteriota bacterium]